MKKYLVVAMVLFVGGLSLVTQAQNDVWSVLAFDETSKAHHASRMLLWPDEDGTMDAYLLVRDIFLQEDGETKKVSWRGTRQHHPVFNGLVQTRGLSSQQLVNQILSQNDQKDTLSGLFWASNLTGWELDNLQDHGDSYSQEIYVRNIGEAPYVREQVIFILRNIPVSDVDGDGAYDIHGQFLLLYPENPDGTQDHVWFHPGWMDTRDYEKYWVSDCLTPSGEIINGYSTADGEFVSMPLNCGE